jgi:NAD-dependent oxidoreductase involved in siderophore biosynthesis
MLSIISDSGINPTCHYTRGTVYPQHGSVRRFVAILEARGAARNVGLMAIVLSACSVQQLQA